MITIDGGPWYSWAIYQQYYQGRDPHDLKQTFERRTLELLNKIGSTKSGQALLKAIRKPITLVPLPDPTEINARAIPLKWGAYPKGLYGSSTGEGSRSTIEFTPDTWTSGTPLYYRNWRRALSESMIITPDEVLYHELVHSVWMSHGWLTKDPMNDGFHDVNEFRAVLLANIYSSELGRPLRRNHEGFSQLSNTEAGPSRYYDKYATEIAKCCTEIPSLTKRIAEVNCPFNPIREHYVYSMPLAGPLILGMTRPG